MIFPIVPITLLSSNKLLAEHKSRGKLPQLISAFIFFSNISALSAAETYTFGMVPQFNIRQVERF